MGTVTRQIDIEAPAPAVWAVLDDLRTSATCPANAVASMHSRIDRPGHQFEQRVVIVGRRATSTWTVTAIHSGTGLVITDARPTGTNYTITDTFESAGPCATTLSLSVDYRLPFGPLGRILCRLGGTRCALDEAEQVLVGVKRDAEARHRSEWTTDGTPSVLVVAATSMD